jgi:hypothetical protein
LTKLEGPKPLQGFYYKKQEGKKEYKARKGRRARHSTAPSSLFRKQRRRQRK